jgi:hypothetical protein
MKKILTIAALTLLTLGGCNKNNEKEENIETPPYAASTQTWTFGVQIWSDAIRIPECDKSDFIDSYTIPDCRSYTDGSPTWYYYNWTYVNVNQAKMCPTPWRVPTREDYELLTRLATKQELSFAWGLSGLCEGDYMYYLGTEANEWTATEAPYGEKNKYAWSFRISANYDAPRITSDWMHMGYRVRCVR